MRLTSLLLGLLVLCDVAVADCKTQDPASLIRSTDCAWDDKLQALEELIDDLMRNQRSGEADDAIETAIEFASRRRAEGIVSLYLLAADHFEVRADQMMPPEFMMPTWNWLNEISDTAKTSISHYGGKMYSRGRVNFPDESEVLDDIRSFESSDIYRRESAYRQSRGYLEAAVAEVRERHGDKDQHLIPVLKRLSENQLREHRSRRAAEKPLEQVVEILANSDPVTRGRALIDLADIYIATGDRRADDTYLKAWSVFTRADASGSLKENFFGATHMIYPRTISLPIWYKVERTEPGEPMFCDFTFSVTRTGKVHSISAETCNVSRNSRKLAEARLRHSFFRPAIEGGKVVGRKDLSHRQYYERASKKWRD